MAWLRCLPPLAFMVLMVGRLEEDGLDWWPVAGLVAASMVLGANLTMAVSGADRGADSA
ncbi:hypothetical protein [Knoellia remsis]|nr:hypothetical protein [Knoellia remsis]